MDINTALKYGGLDEKGISVYLTLLRLGEASMTDLARNAGLKRSTTYLVVETLLTHGFISEIQKKKRKAYSAVHPRRLLEVARFRAHQIETALPEIVALYNTPTTKPKIQVFEGIEGIKSLYREVFHSLSNQKEALWFARIGAIHEFVPEALTEFKKLLRELKNPKIRELNYGDEWGKRWSDETKRLRGKNHFVRILPNDFEFGLSDNLIFENKLVIFSLKDNEFVIIIESEEVVKTYRALFEWAWRQGMDS